MGPGRYIDLSLVADTVMSPSRLYRVRARVVSFNDCTPVTLPAITPVVAINTLGRHIVIGRMKLSRRSGAYKMELHFENARFSQSRHCHRNRMTYDTC